MNVSQPVISAIRGVEFGFLGSEDIRSLSVKRVTVSTTFDTLLNPVPGGLYDAAYGPFGDNACSTCNLKNGCPGHCGHIELPVHVYHPTFMAQCLRLLRAKCVYCHRLRLRRSDVNRYICKLRLIKHGLVKECYDLDEIKARTSASNGSNQTSSDSEASDEADSGIAELMARRTKFTERAIRHAQKTGDWSSHTLESTVAARKAILKDFLSDIGKSRRCASCQGISPTYRKDKFTKIFKKGLSERDKTAMIQAGMKEQDPLILLKRKRHAELDAKKKALAQDEGVADLEDSSMESEPEGEDIEMLDIEGEVAGGITMETGTKSKSAKAAGSGEGFMNAGQVHAALTQLFEAEPDILNLVYGTHNRRGPKAASADMFFIKDVLLPPNKFRPEARTGNDSIAESSDNSLYKNILNTCDDMGQIHKEINGEVEVATNRRRRDYGDFQDTWIKLQDAVNSLIDRDRNPLQGGAAKRAEEGIKQRLEKKEGLFRKNMMGKRVNFAARTVISPDPNIETNEIGVPPVFAVKLTYPEPVTDHNFLELKEAVLNGPYVWPGAVAIENESGQIINLAMKNKEERMALANQLQAPSSTDVSGARPKKVHRHLNNGDIVIMNRQPTLHKPSMMCHRARVLPGEKTLRMHYANCNSYNADFDGDEMNMHFPQNELARSEAINVADTDHQYLSATAAKPLRGLIQDHISMGVVISNRDTFFDREQYQQLIYAAIRPENNHTSTGKIEMIPPAIFKPKPLWTGKQVISTILKNVTPAHYPGIVLDSKSSVAGKNWGPDSEEERVIFRDGHLLCGIMDKSQIGASGGGIVNAVHESYGHVAAGKLLSILGRLLTKLLHMRAFSCGVEDLVFTPAGDDIRKVALAKAAGVGLEVAAKYVSLQASNIKPNDKELRRRLEDVLRDIDKQHGLDAVMKKAVGDVSRDVERSCLPDSLAKPFPKNQMQAMTGSGAKGTRVNANQISCNLGQQVLEGNRVPVMVSGKTLPCFRPFETSARAGGYITDRFLTGVRPQEYYFHAMAGREGLIDTAVKTSRSGYLQRCLVKGLEGLRVEHDTSVRGADGSVVQFLYGEDGLEVTRAKGTRDFKFIGNNYISFFNNLSIHDDFDKVLNEDAQEHLKKADKLFRRTGDLGCCDPTISTYPPSRNAGSMSESIYREAREWMDKNPDKVIREKSSDKGSDSRKISKKAFQRLLEARYLKSVVEAGEAVGVVAGQSVGEPSTQMTLNTFHLAGHAAKNVTLGIPRLREIVMTASMNIPTPTMTLYLNEEIDEASARRFAKGISRLSMAEITDKVSVSEKVGSGIAYDDARTYTVQLDLYPTKEYEEEYAITVDDVTRCIEAKFLARLQRLVRGEIKKFHDIRLLKGKDAQPAIGQSAGTIEQERPGQNTDADAEGGLDDSDDEGDDDATRDKAKNNKNQSGYEAPDDDEQDVLERNRRDESPESEDEGYGGSPGPESRERQANRQSKNSDLEQDSEDEAAAGLKSRIQGSESTHDVVDFSFNRKDSTCTFRMEYPATTGKLLFLAHVEAALHSSLIQTVTGVRGATYVVEGADESARATVQTDGANLIAMREYQDVLNPNALATNDIGAMLTLYGVEACRACIVKELRAVFEGHAISVDVRHLTLIADFMTRHGGYSPFSRAGFAADPSPFMKMSFETTVGFLRDAVLDGDADALLHPSARGVLGRPGKMGTGSFDVLAPVRPWGTEPKGDEVRVHARPEETDEDSDEDDDVRMEVDGED